MCFPNGSQGAVAQDLGAYAQVKRCPPCSLCGSPLRLSGHPPNTCTKPKYWISGQKSIWGTNSVFRFCTCVSPMVPKGRSPRTWAHTLKSSGVPRVISAGLHSHQAVIPQTHVLNLKTGLVVKSRSERLIQYLGFVHVFPQWPPRSARPGLVRIRSSQAVSPV